MDDAAFKKLFSHPRMVTLLIRRHVPEWADRIDYTTLHPLPTELIDEQLRRRYPDMIWRVRTTDGSTDLILLLEFQGRPERHMALRTTIYSCLAHGDVTFEGIFQPTIGGGDDDGHRGDRVPAQPGRD